MNQTNPRPKPYPELHLSVCSLLSGHALFQILKDRSFNGSHQTTRATRFPRQDKPPSIGVIETRPEWYCLVSKKRVPRCHLSRTGADRGSDPPRIPTQAVGCRIVQPLEGYEEEDTREKGTVMLGQYRLLRRPNGPFAMLQIRFSSCTSNQFKARQNLQRFEPMDIDRLNAGVVLTRAR